MIYENENEEKFQEEELKVEPKKQKIKRILKFILDKSEFPRFVFSGTVGTILYYFVSELFVWLLKGWGVGSAEEIGTGVAYFCSILWQHALHR
jgi:putative flippase GtrA